jgi:hypothetical protein
LELGQKAVHTVDPRRRNEHLGRLASAGNDLRGVRENGQFELRDWGNTIFAAADSIRAPRWRYSTKLLRMQSSEGSRL